MNARFEVKPNTGSHVLVPSTLTIEDWTVLRDRVKYSRRYCEEGFSPSDAEYYRGLEVKLDNILEKIS